MFGLLNHAIYSWKGLNTEGQLLKGETASPNLYLAKAKLLSLDIEIIKIRRNFFRLKTKKILKPQVRIQITEQLADLISTGIPITQALETIEQLFPNPEVKTLFWLMKRYIELGQSFGKTLQAFPREFNLNYQMLIQLGEESSQLTNILSRLAALEKKKMLIANKIKKASFYPGLVLFIALFVSSFLFTSIIPRFIEIFEHTKTALPPLTLTLIKLSHFLMNNGCCLIFITAISLLSFIYVFHTSPTIRKTISKIGLSLPWLGTILKTFYLNRINYALSSLLKMGVALKLALELLKKSIGNPLYEEAIETLIHQVEQGYSLSEALRSSPLFPDFMVYSLKIGEESGLLSQSLLKVANFYEARIDQFVDEIALFLEPILMVVLGLVIGIFLIALYLPIFNLGNAV